jgi:NADPH:quinone reductase-like Zn-dependent oxidoreductase
MRAVVCHQYGAELRVATWDPPKVGPDAVQIRVEASAVSAGDWLMAQGLPLLFRPVFTAMLRPPILGLDCAGVVQAVGARVSGFAVGDRVLGEVAHAWADVATARADQLAHLPAGLGSLQAAPLVVSGVTALQAIRDAAQVKAGHRVLIHGASGGVGHFAVQIARSLGAQVTGVCSRAKADFVREMGAMEVIDHQQESWTARRGAWDVILDLVGDQPVAHCIAALRPGGVYLSSAGKNGGSWLGPLPRMASVGVRSILSQNRRLVIFAASPGGQILTELLALVSAGQVRAHVSHVVPLTEVQEGLALIERRQVRGKVAVRITDSDLAAVGCT